MISPLADIKERGFYSQFVNPADIVFDVGANMGNRTKVFLQLNARVIAFEPQNQCADFLEAEYKRNLNFQLVRKALGASEGTEKMFISSAHTISSLSSAWIDATRRSGRFRKGRWEKKQDVEMTTLDKSIQDFGKPSFIKIDVEGYEFEVLSGLSIPVDYISIEFTPEYLENSLRCIDLIQKISRKAEYQISIGESMEFALDAWVSSQTLREALGNVDSKVFGDIYIRCV